MLTPSTPACFAGLYPSAEPGIARFAAWKPILEWVPPQNGFLADAPQRHGAAVFSLGVPIGVLGLDRVRPRAAATPRPRPTRGGGPPEAPTASSVSRLPCNGYAAATM